MRLLLLILIAQFTGLSIAQASDGWEANLIVSVGVAENRLSFGQRPDATDGIDGKYDVPAMLSGDVKAYFLLSDGKYWRDILNGRPYIPLYQRFNPLRYDRSGILHLRNY